MKRKILIIISIVLIIAGISIILIPPVSTAYTTEVAKTELENFDKQTSEENIIDKTDDESSATSYEEAVENNQIDEQGYLLNENKQRISNAPVHFKSDLDRLLKDSIAYNKNLVDTQASVLVDTSYSEPSLNLSDYGIFDNIYGYIDIPSVNIQQPIYLGANDATMSYGVGHLTYTSLPIGGKNTNTVLAAHTGYFGRTFFDNLPYIKKGDSVYIKNYWKTLEYKVITTEVHIPTDSYQMYIEDDKDLLTLITCIYDGGQFNRLYVLCERA